MSYVTTVTKSGQMTIPRVIREQLNITPGQKIRVETTPDAIIVHRHMTDDEFFSALDALDSPENQELVAAHSGQSVSDMIRDYSDSSSGQKDLRESWK